VNHTRFPKEDHLPDWARRYNKVTKGDRVEPIPVIQKGRTEFHFHSSKVLLPMCPSSRTNKLLCTFHARNCIQVGRKVQKIGGNLTYGLTLGTRFAENSWLLNGVTSYTKLHPNRVESTETEAKNSFTPPSKLWLTAPIFTKLMLAR